MSLHFYCFPRSLEMRLSFTGQATVALQTAKRQCFKIIRVLTKLEQSRWFAFLRERLLFLNCSPSIDLKTYLFFFSSWKCLSSELTKDLLLAWMCHLSISSLTRCPPHFGWKWWRWKKWALWAVDLPWVSVANAEGEEVGNSAPARGPDAPSVLHHTSLMGRQTASALMGLQPKSFFSTCLLPPAAKIMPPRESLNPKQTF